MQNKQINIQGIAIPAAAANLFNAAITSVAGGVNITHTQPYVLIRHIRVMNKSALPVNVTMYKGATGASAAGTEFAFGAATVPANGYLDWYGSARFDSTDFLTGVAGTVTTLVANIEGEIGFV